MKDYLLLYIQTILASLTIDALIITDMYLEAKKEGYKIDFDLAESFDLNLATKNKLLALIPFVNFLRSLSNSYEYFNNKDDFFYELNINNCLYNEKTKSFLVDLSVYEIEILEIINNINNVSVNIENQTINIKGYNRRDTEKLAGYIDDLLFEFRYFNEQELDMLKEEFSNYLIDLNERKRTRKK